MMFEIDRDATNASNYGGGDGSQRYTCDPNDGDGLRSYTCNPNDGLRPGSYTSGRNDTRRCETSGSDERRDVRQLPRAVRHKPRVVPRSTTQQRQQHRDGDEGESGKGAIAGDPKSTSRRPDRPRQTTHLPRRYRDFKLL